MNNKINKTKAEFGIELQTTKMTDVKPKCFFYITMKFVLFCSTPFGGNQQLKGVTLRVNTEKVNFGLIISVIYIF